MTKKDIEKGKKQGEEFKAKYGEYPKLPIRVTYQWMSTKAEGELKLTRFGAYQIFGYPGITSADAEEVTDVLFLYDADARLFPGITAKMCGTKPHKRTQ
jgi:hypothetical protein